MPRKPLMTPEEIATRNEVLNAARDAGITTRGESARASPVDYTGEDEDGDGPQKDDDYQLLSRKTRLGPKNREQCEMANRPKPKKGDGSRCYLCGGFFTGVNGMLQCGPQCEHILEYLEADRYGSFQQNLIPNIPGQTVNPNYKLNLQWAHRFCNNAKEGLRQSNGIIVKYTKGRWEINSSSLQKLYAHIQNKMMNKPDCTSIMPTPGNWDSTRFISPLINLLNNDNFVDPGPARGGSSRKTETELVNNYITHILNNQLFHEMKDYYKESSPSKAKVFESMMNWFNKTTDYMTTLNKEEIQKFNIVEYYIKSKNTSTRSTNTPSSPSKNTVKIKTLYYIIFYLQLGLAYGHLKVLNDKVGGKRSHETLKNRVARK